MHYQADLQEGSALRGAGKIRAFGAAEVKRLCAGREPASSATESEQEHKQCCGLWQTPQTPLLSPKPLLPFSYHGQSAGSSPRRWGPCPRHTAGPAAPALR